MSKKKKDIAFEPSKYQKDIFDFISNGSGNLVIEAAAGSGKTYTLCQCLKLIDPNLRTLMVAFNKDIVKELTKKVGNENTNIYISTLHSLGLSLIREFFSSISIRVNDKKYKNYLLDNLHSLSSIKFYKLNKRNQIKYIDNICSLVTYGRYYLADTIEDFEDVAKRYDLDLSYDEIDVACKLLTWGASNVEDVDFADMTWLPCINGIRLESYQFDWVFLDECQDQNPVQMELLKLCMKENTRFVFAGDRNQCIYAFSGSDEKSFDMAKSTPNTTSLPLSISYRCAKNIVKFAQQFVPSIEASPDAIDGEVIMDAPLTDVKDGDMVLCRNNAPLMKAYIEFMRMGIPAHIRGRDIGYNMKHMVELTEEFDLNVNLDKVGVFAKLYQGLFEHRDQFANKCALEVETVEQTSFFNTRLDTIKALEVLSEGLRTSDELIKRIDDIFSDKDLNGISLSTIHKAKGLENDRVFILCKSLMPSKYASKDWELEQEKNLEYVAYTRAKRSLIFLSEEGFSDFELKHDETINSLRIIETKIGKLFNKETMMALNDDEYAKALIKDNKKLVKQKKHVTVKADFKQKEDEAIIHKLSDLFSDKDMKLRKKKKKRSSYPVDLSVKLLK